MTAELTELLAWVADDGRHLAELLRQRAGDRGWRRRGRAVLVRAFSVVDAAAPAGERAAGDRAEGDDGLGALSLVEVTGILREIDDVRVALADPQTPGLRRLAKVRIQRPLREGLQIGRAAAGVEGLVRRIEGRTTVPMAMDDTRLAWFETRCAAAEPGLLRPIRPQDPAGSGERLSTSELELIRKRGRSRYS